MEEKYLVVDGGKFPLNLKELKKQDSDLTDYTVKSAYYLELIHELFGFFPAIISSDKSVLVSTHKEFICDIWKTLTPRNSELKERLFYVHKSGKVGYLLHQNPAEDNLSKPYLLLTEAKLKELEQVTISGESAFDWAPEILGENISKEEFFNIINKATEKVLI